MEHEITCPYCGYNYEMCIDDGRGLEDGVEEEECPNCEATFIVMTEVFISYSHTCAKAPCLNGGEHKWQRQRVFPRFLTKMECVYCGKIRELSKEERIKYDIPASLEKELNK